MGFPFSSSTGGIFSIRYYTYSQSNPANHGWFFISLAPFTPKRFEEFERNNYIVA